MASSTTLDLNNNNTQLLTLQPNGVGPTTAELTSIKIEANPALASNGNHQPKPRGRRKKIRTEPIRPICPQCEKQFSNQSALTKHKLTHSDERKFACQQCSKAFKRHDHLTGHMQTHSNRKPFNCTIQGCDKTYCDARSLRRHKENIHNIITPKDHHHHHLLLHHHHHHHHNNGHLNMNNQDQTSHSIQRRIQRLHSDGSIAYSDHLDEQQLHSQQPQSASSLETIRRQSSDADSSSSTNTTTNTHNPNYHHQQQQCYSADYASNQRFVFDFNHMDQQVSSSNSTLPLSANSVADSGLGHSHQALTSTGDHQHALPSSGGGYLTPITLHPRTPNGNNQTSDQNNNSLVAAPQSAPFGGNPNDQSTYHHQNTAAGAVTTPATTTTLLPPQSYLTMAVDPKSHQPSHLLRRRMQRIHSDVGAYSPATTEEHQLQSQVQPLQQQQYTASLDPIQCPIMDPNNYDQQQAHQQQLSYHSNNNNHHHHQQQHQHAQCYSADYASNQQFSFNFNNMDQQVNSNTISNSILPHSANSVADSGLGHSHQTLPLTGGQHLTNSTSSGGYLTPTTPHPPTPNNNINNNSTSDHNNNNLVTTQSVPFSSNPNDVLTYQQTTVSTTTLLPQRNFSAAISKAQQPSLLLRRRHERLHSDGGVYTTPEDHQVHPSHQQPYAARSDSIRCPSDQIYDQTQSYLHHQQPNQHDQCYSADYASTQQFAFEFDQMPPMNLR